MVYDFLGGSSSPNLGTVKSGFSDIPITRIEQNVTPEGYTKKYATGSFGEQFAGYYDPATGASFSSYSKPASKSAIANWGRMASSGQSFGSTGMAPTKQSPIEFYLGAAPTIPQLNLSDAMSQFRNVYDQVNSGIVPNFNLDPKILQSAVLNFSPKGVTDTDMMNAVQKMASKLQMSPAQIKNIISQVNPSAEEIGLKAAALNDKLNDPGAIAAKASQIANSLNKKYTDAFEKAMPGYKANMAKVNQITEDYLAAKIPRDVVDQTIRTASAKGFATGLYGGGLGRNMVARDLGLTSLQLQSAGANMLQQSADLALKVGQMTMPVTGEGLAGQFITSPTAIFNAMAQHNMVDPNTIYNSVFVPTSQLMAQAGENLRQQAQFGFQAGMQAQQLGFQAVQDYNKMAFAGAQAQAQFQQSKMIAPQTVYETLMNAAQFNHSISMQNALNAWQSQPLPGQFDLSTGKYVGFKPGERTASRPMPPGLTAQFNRPQLPANFARMHPGLAQSILQNYNAQVNAYNQEQEAMKNWTGSAYRPLG